MLRDMQRMAVYSLARPEASEYRGDDIRRIDQRYAVRADIVDVVWLAVCWERQALCNPLLDTQVAPQVVVRAHHIR